METTIEMMGAHGMTHEETATQIRGRDAFNAYCRQPGTRIARIYDDMDAGLDNLQIAIAYRMDIVDVNVYRAAWKAYSNGLVMRAAEVAGHGNELNRRSGCAKSTKEQASISSQRNRSCNEKISRENAKSTETEVIGPQLDGKGIAKNGAEKAQQGGAIKCNGEDWTRLAFNGSGKARLTYAEEKQTRDNQGVNPETHSVNEEAICCRTQRRTAALTTNAQPGHAQAVPVIDLAESVRALMQEGAGVSRIAARLGITRVKATLIMQKIERGG